MRIIINQSDVERIIAFAVTLAPEEACGLIAGEDRPDGVRQIRKVYLLTNMDHAREHFTIDPREQLNAIRDMRANGLKPLGNWHSHPQSPARPSIEDQRLANDSQASYLILSLADPGKPILHAFHIEGPAHARKVRKEELERMEEAMDFQVDERVDITDVVCPVTFVKTKVALEELEDGQILQVHLNDGESVQNVPRSIKDEGHQVLKLNKNDDGTYELYIRKRGD